MSTSAPPNGQPQTSAGNPPPTKGNPHYPGRYGTWENHAKLYEDGKHRRYELLFAVNGGALAIGKFFIEQEKAKIFLKNLSLDQVALGMIAFTVVMWWDIMTFGLRMRKDGTKEQKKEDVTKVAQSEKSGSLLQDKRTEGTFGLWGQVVLTAICGLIIVAWALVIGSWADFNAAIFFEKPTVTNTTTAK